jgi:hypothetical protein
MSVIALGLTILSSGLPMSVCAKIVVSGGSRLTQALAALVVVSQLRNQQRPIHNLVHNSVLVVDAPGPISRQSMFERLGLADTGVRSSGDLLDQFIDSLQQLLV